MGFDDELYNRASSLQSLFLVESEVLEVVRVFEDVELELGVIDRGGGELKEHVVDPDLVEEVVDIDEDADPSRDPLEGGPVHVHELVDDAEGEVHNGDLVEGVQGGVEVGHRFLDSLPVSGDE